MATSLVDMMPSSGRATMGIMEVMGRGRASVIQYTAISRIVYRHASASPVCGSLKREEVLYKNS